MANLVIKKKPEKRKLSFTLDSFIKDKILGMYGIKKRSKIKAKRREETVSDLLPHDSTKI